MSLVMSFTISISYCSGSCGLVTFPVSATIESDGFVIFGEIDYQGSPHPNCPQNHEPESPARLAHHDVSDLDTIGAGELIFGLRVPRGSRGSARVLVRAADHDAARTGEGQAA
jgi:hypothetical protein